MKSTWSLEVNKLKTELAEHVAHTALVNDQVSRVSRCAGEKLVTYLSVGCLTELNKCIQNQVCLMCCSREADSDSGITQVIYHRLSDNTCLWAQWSRTGKVR